MVDHPSHVTRFSDSSFYDEICVLCGTTDGPGGLLEASCPVGKNLKKTHTFEVLYAPERTERKKIRCKTCGETSADILSAFECTNPSEEKRIHAFEDVDVMRKIEGTDGREGLSWLETADDLPTPEPDPEDWGTIPEKYASGGVITSIRPLSEPFPTLAGNVSPSIEPFEDVERSMARPHHERFRGFLAALLDTHQNRATAGDKVWKEIEAIRDFLKQLDAAEGTTIPVVVVNISGAEVSATALMSAAAKRALDSAGLNLPGRGEAPSKGIDLNEAALAYKEKIAASALAEEALAAKIKAAGEAPSELLKDIPFLTADGKTPQYGTKLPDADFIPLYRSEKDA